MPGKCTKREEMNPITLKRRQLGRKSARGLWCVPDVRYGSLADITVSSRHVRFSPNSGHSSVHVGCPKVPEAGARVQVLPNGRRASRASPAMQHKGNMVFV